ncbi:Cytoplasmic protein [uncultured Gammaproteobacteria bacterium]
MPLPLMPKATAVWLVENTALTFEQVADFCGMHALEVQAIADGEVATGMAGLDPVANGQLAQTEIGRCVKDPRARLRLSVQDLPQPVSRSKGPRYTPVTKRGDKPDAIAWLLKQHPELSEAQVCRLIGTTKPTIAAVRDRTHWNATNIKQRSPVLAGLCTQRELDEVLTQARRSAPPSSLLTGEAAGDGGGYAATEGEDHADRARGGEAHHDYGRDD